MPGLQQVSFNTPDSEEDRDIERRRQMAMMLQQQGAQGLPTESFGGYAVRRSPLEYLNKTAQQWLGAYGMNQASEQAKALREKREGDVTADMGTMVQALKPRPETPETTLPPLTQNDDEGNQMPAAIAPGVPAKAGGVIDPNLIAQLRSPQMKQFAMQQVMAGMQPKAPIPLSEGQTLLDPTTYKPIAAAPKYSTVGGNLVPHPGIGGGEVKPVFTAPERDEAAKFNAILTGAGIDPASQQGQALFQALAMKTATHQPAASTTVKVNSFTPASEEAQKDFMKGLRTRYDQLQSAPSVLENIEKAKQLIPQAKGLLGSGAETKLEAVKFLNNNLGTSINVEGVKNAEEIRSRLFMGVMENLKKMDAQPSQKQQDLLQKGLGEIGTDPNALPRVLDVFGDIVRNKVDIHNKEVAGSVERGVKFPYDPTIKLPDAKAGGGGPTMYAVNPQTKARIMSTDGGKTWKPAQ